MSDMTGWRSGGRACGCWKRINGTRYEISGEPDQFVLHYTSHGYTFLIGFYPTIADAKRAAHEHARDAK